MVMTEPLSGMVFDKGMEGHESGTTAAKIDLTVEFVSIGYGMNLAPEKASLTRWSALLCLRKRMSNRMPTNSDAIDFK